MNRIPTIAGLQAFESAARHRSFTRAAAELNRTQGAISQQIRQLEEQLGVALFERVRQRVVLTGAGAAYLADIQKVLANLVEATHRTIAAGDNRLFNLGVLPSFANSWLIYKIPGFLALRPDVSISFISRNLPFDFAESGLDAAIHYGQPAWAGAAIDFLMHENKVAVCSPAFWERHAIKGPAELAGAPLLQLRSHSSAWNDWFAALNIQAEDSGKGLRFDSFNLIAAAAKLSLGAGLIPRLLVKNDIESGHLKLISETTHRTSMAYYFVCPEEKRNTPLIKLFREWILTEIRKDSCAAELE